MPYLLAAEGEQGKGDDAEQIIDYMAAEEGGNGDESAAQQYVDALVERTAPGCYNPGLAALVADAEAGEPIRVQPPTCLSLSHEIAPPAG